MPKPKKATTTATSTALTSAPSVALGAAPGSDHVTPAPHASLDVTHGKLSTTAVYHRVHHEKYGATQFNPGAGNARFSPINDANGVPVPTIYAATTFAAAAMETVFHDVPFEPGFKHFDKNKLEGQVHSTVTVKVDLVLADLGTIALRKLGVKRTQLIETDKDQYPLSRKWAEAIHAQHADIQGLSWVSRQDDSARAVVLFGDRIPDGVLQQTGSSRSLLMDDAAYDEVLNLAGRLKVNVVAGK